jgi:sugar phosphate isomerase/epimerase
MRHELGFETVGHSSVFPEPAVNPFRLVRAAKAAGFDWISFDRRTLAEQSRADGGIPALLDACRAAELPCRCTQSLMLTDDATADARSFDRLVEQVRVLRPDVVPIIVQARPTPERVATLRARTARLAEHHCGVRFCVEFGPVFAVRSVAAALRLVEEIGDRRVGLLLDTWHLFTSPVSWRTLRELSADRIALVQVSDHGPVAPPELAEARTHRLLPGAGSLPLADFMRLLAHKRYTGLISVEVISAELRALPVEDFAASAMSAMAPLLDLASW